MTSIDMVSILTTLYVLVDEWYQHTGHRLLKGKPGAKPEFSDSEMLTLMLAHDFMPYPGESQYIGYIRANYRREFPKLVDQSQYNRRARKLGYLVEPLRREWLGQLGIGDPNQLLVDADPSGRLQAHQSAQRIRRECGLRALRRAQTELLWL